jgi:DNA-binding beta-propeller fold protein YncE
MNFTKTFYLFILACLLLACAAPATPAPVSPEPAIPTSTAHPAATATTPATLAMPTATEAAPKTIDPGSSVIQISYPSNSGLSNSILSLLDPATGNTLPSSKSFSGNMDAITAIPGRLAAVQGKNHACEPMAYGTSCYIQADVLHLVNLTTLQEITATLPAKGWVQLAAFSPDGTQLALADNHAQEGSSLLVFDAENGSLLASQPLSIRPSLIAFRPGKNQLVVYGQSLGPNPGVQQPPNPHVLLLNLPDLKVAWDGELTGVLSGFWCETNCDGSVEQSSFAIWFPLVVMAPDGSTLLIAKADQNSLTHIDLQTHRVTTTNLQTASAWLEQLLSLTPQVAYAKGNENGASLQGVLSPDGKRLYLLAQNFHSTLGANGNWNTDISYSGLKVIDVKTGRILKQLDTHASEVQISTDGNLLYMMNWDSPQAETEIVNTDQLQIVKKLVGWEVTLMRRLDGTPIALANQVDSSTVQEVGIFDPQSFSIEKTWKASDNVQFVTFK